MRSLTMALGLVLILGAGASAQTAPSVVPVLAYENSYRVIDSFGNLVVFDFGHAYAPMPTIRGRESRGPRDPMTRITIVRPSGAPETREYAASMSVVGVGARAVYAIGSTRTTSGTSTTTENKLIALNPQLSLPATLAAATGMVLPGARFNVDMGQPDIISILTEAIRTSIRTGTTVTTTTTPRTVKVVRFNGTSFDTVSTATLP